MIVRFAELVVGLFFQTFAAVFGATVVGATGRAGVRVFSRLWDVFAVVAIMVVCHDLPPFDVREPV